MKKLFFIIPFLVLLVGCEERYRYPCQNPENWDSQYCKKPFCSANGTCPENLQHYDKDNKPAVLSVQPKQTTSNNNNTGGCK